MSLTPSATPATDTAEMRGVPFMTHAAALWILRNNLEMSLAPRSRNSRKFQKALQLLQDSLLPVMTKIDEMNEKERLEHNARIRERNERSLTLMVAGHPIRLGAERPAGA
jgi:hypothetical protein